MKAGTTWAGDIPLSPPGDTAQPLPPGQGRGAQLGSGVSLGLVTGL